MRDSALKNVSSRVFDLLVLGGGINGAGIAREAALRGLSVCLVEEKDWAQGSSSRTTKLVHGGLRYLENGQFKLVFEASRERRLLAGRLAPHLVRPIPILIPMYQGDARAPWLIKTGLWLYDLLALFRNVRRHEILDREEALSRVPDLEPRGLLGAAITWDCRMHDARLVWENVLSARQAGALCLNYTSLESCASTAIGAFRGVLADERGGRAAVRARLCVNATGPWSDKVASFLSRGPSHKLRPSKGIHLVTRPLTAQGTALLMSIPEDKRVFFIIPRDFEGRPASLIGTTDDDFRGDPGKVRAEEREIRYLISQANRFLPSARLRRKDIWSTYAGVRPLAAPPREGLSEGATPRESVLVQEGGVLSVTGGKFTTYRPLCQQAVEKAAVMLGIHLPPSRSAAQTLPGAPGQPWEGWRVKESKALVAGGLSPQSAQWLLSVHGSQAPAVFELARRDRRLAGPAEPGFAPILAQVAWAARQEDARHLEDFYLRRSFLGLVAGPSQAGMRKVAQVMGRELGWDPARRQREVRGFQALLKAQYR